MPVAKQISKTLRSTTSHPDGLSILLASNATSRSSLALSAARFIASDRLKQLEIVQIVDPNKSREDATGLLEKLETTVQDKLPDLNTTITLTVRGYPEYLDDEEAGRAQAIHDVAQEKAIDLIVLGRHSQTTSKRRFMGTMSARLLEKPGCPVVVAVNDPPRPYKHIGIAVDFSTASHALVKAVSTLLPRGQVSLIHILSEDAADVKEQAKAGLSTIAADLEASGFDVKQRFGIGRPGHALNAIVRNGDIDILVLGTHGRTGIQKALLGSVSQELIDNPPCDVLAVNPD